MEHKSKQVCFTHFQSLDELETEDLELVEKACSMINTAYAPYSKFRVGAAVSIEGGICIGGSNQENEVYPSGLCAERVALFASSAQYPDKTTRGMAIAALNPGDNPQSAFPCGGCLQVLHEYEKRQKQKIKILVVENATSIYLFDGVEQLLPFAFQLI